MQRTKKEYDELREKAREKFLRFLRRVKKNARAKKGDDRILATIGGKVGLDSETVSKYVSDLLNHPALVNALKGEWIDEGATFMFPPVISRHGSIPQDNMLLTIICGKTV